MKISLIAAMSNNSVIGNGPNIPWSAKGEMLLFKAMTYNEWLIVGRKTFESMGALPNRSYAVISRTGFVTANPKVLVFPSIGEALEKLAMVTDHVMIAGGGDIYKQTIEMADTIHLSTIDTYADGDVYFPNIPENFNLVFEKDFQSNINYTYRIWKKDNT